MIKLIASAGRPRTVAVISIAASAASIAVVAIAGVVLGSFGISMNYDIAIPLAGIVPLIVAPALTWYLVGLMLHITRLEGEMRSLASYDALTGLLSRHAFFDRANNYVSLARRDRSVFSVLIADLDHFKSINDQFGHPAGDAVLRLFADVVNSVARRSDLVGRLGGEEFAMILPSTGTPEALEFSERLHDAIQKAVLKHGDKLIEYTASIGVTSFDPESDESLDNLLARADLALYEAKANGRNQTAVFTDRNAQTAAS